MADERPIKVWLKRLAVIAVGLTTGNVSAADLAAIPEPTVFELIADGERADTDDADRRRILEIFAQDPRAAVRLDVAASLSIRAEATRENTAESLIAALVDDENAAVRLIAAQDLVVHLCRLAPVARTHLVARWALDPSARKRRALAQALGAGQETVGARTALDHLTRDRFAHVRSAAVASQGALELARGRRGLA